MVITDRTWAATVLGLALLALLAPPGRCEDVAPPYGTRLMATYRHPPANRHRRHHRRRRRRRRRCDHYRRCDHRRYDHHHDRTTYPRTHAVLQSHRRCSIGFVRMAVTSTRRPTSPPTIPVRCCHTWLPYVVTYHSLAWRTFSAGQSSNSSARPLVRSSARPLVRSSTYHAVAHIPPYCPYRRPPLPTYRPTDRCQAQFVACTRRPASTSVTTCCVCRGVW